MTIGRIYNMKKNIISHRFYSVIISTVLALLFNACGGGESTKPNKLDIQNKNANDVNKPKITLIGKKTIFLQLGDSYTDPGAFAYDQEDGNLTSQITKESNINFQKIGNYEIIYHVTDSAGNSDTAKRKVSIQNIINNPSPRPGLTINEFLAANTHSGMDPDFKQFSDWIELYNNSNSDINIGGYYLSDDPKVLNKWRIPNGIVIKANDYLLIWADKEDVSKKQLHTNFSLNADGETVVLTDSNQRKVDEIKFPKQKSDISCMKNSDNILYYMYPTPEKINTQANSALFRSSEPVFTLQSGFYNTIQTLTITQKNGGQIYYTTDGSIPTKRSNKYSNPITIDKTTVIRAKALEDGKFFSSTENGTYFIGSTDRKISIPVISVAINPDYLFNEDYGMYTIGTGHTLDDGHENFRQDWERSASVEYFDKNHISQFSQNIGLSIFGNYTRRYAKKSFAVKTKDKYGKKSIKYKLFPQKDINKFTSFGIRSGGNGWHTSIFKDAMLQDLVHENMDIDYQANQPVILFVNGEYWGISYLRERFTKDYFKENNHVEEKVDLLEFDGKVKKGNAKDYIDLLAYINTHNLENDDAFKYVTNKIDLNNYLNYMIIEIYTGNLDWPNNNVRYWKEEREGSKWRWLVYDLDFSFGLSDFDNLSYAAGDLIDPVNKSNQPEWSTFLFKHMLENQTFRYRFIGKYLTHIYTTFDPQRVDAFIDKYKRQIASEIPRDTERWRNIHQYGSQRNLISFQQWEGKVSSLHSFAALRPNFAKQHIEDYFKIRTYHTVSINLPENGQIIIDDVHLNKDFSERYLEGAIIELKAIPDKGYQFIRWSDGKTNPVRQLQINSDIPPLEAEFSLL